MHDVPVADFLVFAIFMLALFVSACWEGYSRAKRLRAELYENIAKQHKTEDEYHELMLHTISCRMLMWKSGVQTPDLPPHLSKHKISPRGPVN